jgi:O-acetyl-ADP-ribose deacetylase (regulator of RNase III)
MTGSGRSDIVGSYGSGTWYRYSATGSWAKITTSAEQVTTGDLNGDGRDDLIGVWSDGVWVRYAVTNQWQKITASKPTWITTGRTADAIQAMGGIDDPDESGENVLDRTVIDHASNFAKIGIIEKEANMIEYKSGDILREDAEALINTVNCVGIMGRGIALQFKNAFPENFRVYAAACKKHEVQPGKMFVYETDQLTNPRFIVNFPTKRHWRGKSRMEDVETGLKALVETIRTYNIQSIAIPPLGSGLGGLDWFQVKPRIEAAMKALPEIRVIIFEPKGAPTTEKMVHNREVPKMTAGRAALVELMHRYLAGLLDPFVTLLEVHKLMYFLQEAGEPLRLRYQKAPYGPYSENLRHVLRAIEGHLVSGYADGGDAPNKQLNLVPGAIEDAKAFLQQHAETRKRFDKVSELVEGFESPFGLELLSTVHWIMKNETVKSKDDLVRHTYTWNDRKRQFTSRQILLAVDVLSNNGWISKDWN